MDWRSSRFRIVVGALTTAVVVIWFLWWRSPDIQAPRTFAQIQAAIAAGNGGNLLAEVHPDYNFSTLWPTVPWNELGAGEARLLAQRSLTALFFMHRDNPLSLAVDVQSVTVGSDGRVIAVVTMQLTSQQGTLPFKLGAIRKHRFVLASTSWTGHLAIIDHDPIAFEQ